MTSLSTTDKLAARGYTHTPSTRPHTGRRAVVRNGRIVTIGDCFEVEKWIARLDRKVAALRGPL